MHGESEEIGRDEERRLEGIIEPVRRQGLGLSGASLTDLPFIAAFAAAAYMGGASLWAAWLTWRARGRWLADPVEFLRSASGSNVTDSDVRFVAALGAVGNSEWVDAPWIVCVVSSEVMVVESMIPWPLHGPKVIIRRETGLLQIEGEYIRDSTRTIAITVRRDRERFFQMFRDLGWIESGQAVGA